MKTKPKPQPLSAQYLTGYDIARQNIRLGEIALVKAMLQRTAHLGGNRDYCNGARAAVEEIEGIK